MNRLHCAIAAASSVVVALGGAATAHTDPPPADATVNPYPDIRYYDQLDAGSFVQPGGVWFTASTGQNCGIWGLGSFGCAGDIPGAPPGVSHIGWIDGDRAVHYDWSVAVRFPAAQGQQPLPPRSKVTHEGTTCAATPDGRTYCERGPLRFVIEPTKTWLSASWTDQSWRELGPASCSPPGGGPCYS
ncbi:Uncharacterised protein [Mycobacteroides abscessus subsp. bolletii]|uniref:hypothetical protein n=1 Tax=Mycobacteroides abscessus TaxID=36809 RepID=UPI0002E1DB91|nr:hypothetical protein [Mycobacteroides abscessus]AKP57204.1 hypothetical protein MAUC22_05640 [Mycobacteroides abscessus UC22]ORA29432.1 hypothetical protein BST18_06155 [Mycobacteroides abscessus subsp. bolletii]TPF65652.1 hypothetical protein XW60_24095 [Mycobacteroides abscessus subsp. bolletii]SHO89400.1 Uncharacterised protein [Mycobacteroides abscessus subsp. abscessus]SHZ23434.1 Uncharacterised protein [Mycobacteroides abscessus subsp. bolletii]